MTLPRCFPCRSPYIADAATSAGLAAVPLVPEDRWHVRNRVLKEMPRKHPHYGAANGDLRKVFDRIHSDIAGCGARFAGAGEFCSALDAWLQRWSSSGSKAGLYDRLFTDKGVAKPVAGGAAVAAAVAKVKAGAAALFLRRDTAELKGTTANEQFHCYVNRRFGRVSDMRLDHMLPLLEWQMLLYNNSAAPCALERMGDELTQEQQDLLRRLFVPAAKLPDLYAAGAAGGGVPYIIAETSMVKHVSLGGASVPARNATTAEDQAVLADTVKSIEQGQLKPTLKQQRSLASYIQGVALPDLTVSSISTMLERLAAAREQQQQPAEGSGSQDSRASIPPELPCDVCGSPDDEASMIICDGCTHGFHLSCLTPPLTEVPPERNWYCTACADKKLKGRQSKKASKRGRSK